MADSGTILIYGGSGGIGREIVFRLHAGGSRVHLVGRDPARLEAVATETRAGFTAGDVRDNSTFAAASEAAGPLAGLVYAVGTINLKPLPRLTDADFVADFQINALGAAKAIQAALPNLRAGPGTASIVLFSTVAVRQGFSAHASVAMAKGAVEGLTRSLAAELAPKIRVNAIAPSLIRTPLAGRLASDERMAGAIADLHPLQRLGEPADVAAVATFLLSADAGWITGQVFGVDGGRSSLRTKG